MAGMIQSVPTLIGLRYIRAKRRNSFISFVSIFAFAGMALGVLALIVVLSVMNGFDRELKGRILRVVPHGSVTGDQPLKDWQSVNNTLANIPELIGSAPVVSGHGLLSFDARVKGIQVEGVDPSLEPDVSDVHEFMLYGELASVLEPKQYNIVLGSLLARYLRVTIGDKVSLTLPALTVTPAGVFPRTKRFTVAGVFEVGAQVDQSLAIIHIKDAQTLFRKGQAVDGVRLRFEDLYKAPSQIHKVKSALSEATAREPSKTYQVKDWSQTQGSLFQAIKMEKTMVGVMLSIIIAVAAFNIITSLIMMIAEKRSDIAVLRTMGLPASGVIKVFMVQGVSIGVVGVFIGATLGVLIAANLPSIVAWLEQALASQIFDPTVYFVTAMPSHLQWMDVAWVCAGALTISLLATCYPAYKAAQISPAEALRYNV